MKKNGFTLIEILIVIVLLGIISGFAIPSYSKAINKAHEKDTVVQLTAIHAGNMIYKAQSGSYLTGTNKNLSYVNSNLKLNVIANSATYNYTGASATFAATAQYGSFTVKVTHAAISSSNPCCNSGSCPSLTACR
ncbi:MAG: type II secretion system protein [Candidatus Zapsychrus exili]|nr:type II secretion system protein [Candidatus Zapsychrus exili]